MQGRNISITRIISGGQTGADRAALDFAISRGISHGGCIPKGRRTEEGSLPEKYKLREMPTASYPERTAQNVIDSDGTLIVSRGSLRGGSALTRRLAAQYRKPCLHIDLKETLQDEAVPRIREWVNSNAIAILNVAGPRASENPDIYRETLGLLENTFGAG